MQDLSNPASGQTSEPDLTDVDVNPTADDHSHAEGRDPGSLHSLSIEDDPGGTTDPADIAGSEEADSDGANSDGRDSDGSPTDGAESRKTAVDVHAAPEHSDATE